MRTVDIVRLEAKGSNCTLIWLEVKPLNARLTIFLRCFGEWEESISISGWSLLVKNWNHIMRTIVLRSQSLDEREAIYKKCPLSHTTISWRYSFGISTYTQHKKCFVAILDWNRNRNLIKWLQQLFWVDEQFNFLLWSACNTATKG